MKRKIAVIYIICFVSAFLCPFRAFAYDSQYVNEFEKWTANESAEWLELKGDSATGYMQYFTAIIALTSISLFKAAILQRMMILCISPPILRI